MALLGAATVIIWVLALLCGVRVFQRGSWFVRARRLVVAIGCAAVAVLCSSLLILLQAFYAFSGGIVKWHPWLTSLGLASYHKPIRISGQFSDLDQQRAQLPTVHALAPGTDWCWEALYRAAPYLPFVEAVYGSAASVYVEPDVVQAIYVTPTGYLIKRKRS